MDGIINVNKEAGMTSFDVLRALKKILHEKKMGHAGTLDPMAEGVLLVCVGKATKLVESLMSEVKVYRAEMLLGVETDTEDSTGKRLSEEKKYYPPFILFLEKESRFLPCTARRRWMESDSTVWQEKES